MPRRRNETMCAPGVQSEVCRICGKLIMEGNAARWAHDQCIETERARNSDLHLPDPDEIARVCLEIRAENVDYREGLEGPHWEHMERPKQVFQSRSNRRGRVVQ